MPVQAMPMALIGMLVYPLDTMTVGGRGITETALTGTGTGTGTESGIIAATVVKDMGTANVVAVTAQRRQVATEMEAGTEIGVEILAETGLPATALLLLL